VVITGEIGSGKTTLIESFLKEVPADVVVRRSTRPRYRPSISCRRCWCSRLLALQMRKAELISTVNNFLIEHYAAGRKVLLIVDEAQNLTMRVLEEIRLLSGVETPRTRCLRSFSPDSPSSRQARRARARAAHAGACGCGSPANAVGAGKRTATFSTGWRLPSRGPRDFRRRYVCRGVSLLPAA